MDDEEVKALERPAACVGIPPSVLGRNLARVGLMSQDLLGLSPIVDRLESALAELRALVP